MRAPRETCYCVRTPRELYYYVLKYELHERLADMNSTRIMLLYAWELSYYVNMYVRTIYENCVVTKLKHIIGS